MLIWKNFKALYLKIGTKKTATQPFTPSYNKIHQPSHKNGHTAENKTLPGRFSPICKPDVKHSPEYPKKSPSNVKQM